MQSNQTIAALKAKLLELWQEQERIEQSIYEHIQYSVPPILDNSDWTKLDTA